jgi:hypothetical protein
LNRHRHVPYSKTRCDAGIRRQTQASPEVAVAAPV